MNAEKRVWLAALLSVVLLLFYSSYFSKSAQKQPQQEQTQQQIAPEIKADTPQQEFMKPSIDEETIQLDSGELLIQVGARSAEIKHVTLKAHKDHITGNPLMFGWDYPVVHLEIDGLNNWKLVQATGMWESIAPDGTRYILRFSTGKSKYDVSIDLDVIGSADKAYKAKMFTTWHRSDAGVSSSYNQIEAVVRTEKESPWQRLYLKYGPKLKDVPRRTFVVTLTERFFCISAKLGSPSEHVRILPIKNGIGSEISLNLAQGRTHIASVYVGPRDFFNLQKAGFDQAFHLGFLAKIGLILMVVLRAIAAVVKNYGVAIILLGALVTAVLSPFTLMSLKSMKRMQALQPKIDQLRKKHEKDQTKLNQEMFQLFKEHKVSPMGGCLPMLIQLPIFFALWAAISHVVEMRGAKFLWIQDLSLPDRLAHLPMGFDLNLLPILMALAMYFQTKMSQPSTPTGQKNPMAGPLMPILFGFMFYQVPSGLVLYWLTNSLVSITSYKMAKV